MRGKAQRNSDQCEHEAGRGEGEAPVELNLVIASFQVSVGRGSRIDLRQKGAVSTLAGCIAQQAMQALLGHRLQVANAALGGTR